jgi:hypothetical protein
MTGMYNVLEKLRAAERAAIGADRLDVGEARAAAGHAPPAGQDASAVREGASAVREGASAVREGAPAVREDAPAVREDAPAVREGAPAVREDAPAVREGAPVVREGALAVREGALAVREGAPVVREGAPAIREGAPAVREGALAVQKYQEKTPHQRDQPPVAITLTTKERKIHEQGLVSVLKQIHDDLDAAVFDAYGWPHDLDDEQILQRLVDLNRERAAEEARGVVRWLRPEFQNPDGKPATQTRLDIDEAEPIAAKPAKLAKQAWPAALPERFRAVRTALSQHAAPATAADVSKYFTRARKTNVEEILDTLVSVGQLRQTDDGRYVA